MSAPKPAELRRMRAEADRRREKSERQRLAAIERRGRQIEARNASAPGPLVPPAELGIRVVARTHWQIHGATVDSGIVGQLTAIDVCGVRAFVRENVHVVGGSFMLHAGQRERAKRTGVMPNAIDVLDVSAPKHALACVLDAVRKADGLRREVRTHQQFTERWAIHEFSRSRVRLDPALPAAPSKYGQLALF